MWKYSNLNILYFYGVNLAAEVFRTLIGYYYPHALFFPHPLSTFHLLPPSSLLSVFFPILSTFCLIPPPSLPSRNPSTTPTHSTTPCHLIPPHPHYHPQTRLLPPLPLLPLYISRPKSVNFFWSSDLVKHYKTALNKISEGKSGIKIYDWQHLEAKPNLQVYFINFGMVEDFLDYQYLIH